MAELRPGLKIRTFLDYPVYVQIEQTVKHRFRSDKVISEWYGPYTKKQSYINQNIIFSDYFPENINSANLKVTVFMKIDGIDGCENYKIGDNEFTGLILMENQELSAFQFRKQFYHRNINIIYDYKRAYYHADVVYNNASMRICRSDGEQYRNGTRCKCRKSFCESGRELGNGVFYLCQKALIDQPDYALKVKTSSWYQLVKKSNDTGLKSFLNFINNKTPTPGEVTQLLQINGNCGGDTKILPAHDVIGRSESKISVSSQISAASNLFYDDTAKKHIMLSYNWADQELVEAVYEELEFKGFKVWMDIKGGIKNGDIFGSMAEGVQKASVIVPFCTKKYEESECCQKELKYAVNNKIPIVPVKIDANFKLENWLGIVLTNILWYVVNPENFDQEIGKLLKAIEERIPE